MLLFDVFFRIDLLFFLLRLFREVLKLDMPLLELLLDLRQTPVGYLEDVIGQSFLNPVGHTDFSPLIDEVEGCHDFGLFIFF